MTRATRTGTGRWWSASTHPLGVNIHQPKAISLPRRHVLADLFAPRFQILLHQSHELVSDGAVNEAVVVAEREVNDGANGDGIVAFFVGDDEGLLGNASHAHDGGVRLIDDGQAKNGAELAGVGDGEGGAFDVLRLEFLATGAFAEVGDTALQTEEVEVAGILEDGDDESPVEGDGNAYINVAVVADVIAFERGVDDWPLLDRDDGGAHEEWHEGEADAVALLEGVLVFGTQGDDAGEIHFIHAVDVSAGTARLDHALGDDLAHVGHGDEVAGIGRGSGWSRWSGCGLRSRGGGSRGSRRWALDEGHDVLLGDAAA